MSSFVQLAPGLLVDLDRILTVEGVHKLDRANVPILDSQGEYAWAGSRLGLEHGVYQDAPQTPLQMLSLLDERGLVLDRK